MRLIVLGIPFAKQSFSCNRNGHKYQTRKVKLGEKSVKAQVEAQLPDRFVRFTGPVIVKELLFVFPPLKSFSKDLLLQMEFGTRVYKSTRPDLTDNLQKGLFDAMQGVVYLNDSQICHVERACKVYGSPPRIEIDIDEFPGRGSGREIVPVMDGLYCITEP